MIKAVPYNAYYVLLLLCILVSCNGGPKPIKYGSDGCHFCSMTIVDTQHAAQYVTKKGRAYKFDAIECMMNQLNEVEANTIATLLVNDYDNPGTLIDASTAYYLYSKEIPSPMGEFLSAFNSEKSIVSILEKHEGKQLSWEDLKARFKRDKEGE